MKSVTSLSTIVYPVFLIGKIEPYTEDGVTCLFRSRTHLETGEDRHDVRVIDDKNLSQPTLSSRRLALSAQGVDLYPLKYAIYFLGDLVKLSTPKTWFIDNNGKVFNYIKATKAKLNFRKIRQLIPITTGGVIVEVDGVASRFKSLYMPEKGKTHAGILTFGMSHILYGFYDQEYKSTWRTV